MISAYAKAGEGSAATELFGGMVRDGLCPDDYSMTAVLSGAVAAEAIDLRRCRQLHCAVVKYVGDSVVSVSNALIALYFKCSDKDAVVEARKLFEEMPARDELTWTTVLVGYTRLNDLKSARKLFEGMPKRFNVVWNAMISGYLHQGHISEALQMFREMNSEGVTSDEFTYTSVISACTSSGLFTSGKAVHGRIIRSSIFLFSPSSSLPVENALITLYSGSRELNLATRVFDRIETKDTVSWNAILSGLVDGGRIQEAREIFSSMPCKNRVAYTVIISGLAQNGFGEEGLRLFKSMKREGIIDPCDFAYSAAFTSCATIGALEQGRQLHGELVKSGCSSSNSAGNSLLTMYAKCGAMEAAQAVFLSMTNLDSVSWNAMVAAFGQHGRGVDAVDLFEEMLQRKVPPDRITFLTILSACNHAGLVEEGVEYFKVMEKDYNFIPGEDHYTQLIDLLGRAGRLEETMNLLKSLPFEPTPAIWEAVLSSCRIHNAMDLGVKAADELLKMSPNHDGAYMLLANIYASVHRWEDVARVRKMMRERHVRKEPGCSWVEVSGKVNVFLANDSTHPEVREIYRFLEILGARMRKMGYVADTRLVLRDLEDWEKELVLSRHSERLAVAFGMMKLPELATVRVFKNLRICGDCHVAVMFMALAVGKEVIVRDGRRFHHFKDGSCSCGNYW